MPSTADTTDSEPGPDPLAHIRLGAPCPPREYGSGRKMCAALHDRGYECTRARHPDTWQHIAHGSQRVAAVWGGVPADD